MTLGCISRIFNGKRRARLSTLKSIANLYCEGRVEDVKAIIKRRVLDKLKYSKIGAAERNEMLRRVSDY